MSEVPAQKKKAPPAIPVWGVIFLFGGVILLLQALNVLSWALWGKLWKFWPVIIIIFGISFLLRRRVIIGTLLSAAVLGICLWIAIGQASPALSNDLWHVEQSYSFPAGGVDQTEARISFAAPGNLLIAALPADSTDLVTVDDSNNAKYQRTSRDGTDSVAVNFNKDGDIGKVSLSPVNENQWDKWHIAWNVKFNQSVPLTLDIDCDVVYAALDLNDVNLRDLTLKLDVGSGILDLPAASGTTIVDIDMDVSNLEINVPEGVAAKITADNSMSYMKVDGRFVKEGDYYISPGYDTATNRVELNIVCDLGRVTIQ